MKVLLYCSVENIGTIVNAVLCYSLSGHYDYHDLRFSIVWSVFCEQQNLTSCKSWMPRLSKLSNNGQNCQRNQNCQQQQQKTLPKILPGHVSSSLWLNVSINKVPSVTEWVSE